MTLKVQNCIGDGNQYSIGVDAESPYGDKMVYMCSRCGAVVERGANCVLCWRLTARDAAEWKANREKDNG